MKLPYKITPTELSRGEYIKKLKSRRRMNRIGSGVFGTVFASKTGRTVVKVGAIEHYGKWGGDHGNVQYLRYLSLASKFKRNPLFPKIFSVEVFKQKSTDSMYMVVEMEKLKELKPGMGTVASMIEYCLEDKESFEASKMLFGKLSKSVEQAHKVLHTMSHKYNASLDLHSENVMVRYGGQVVITDPVC